MTNPGKTNPGIANPGIANPGIANPGIANAGIGNPGVSNPAGSVAAVGRVADSANLFVEVTPGRFAQSNPQPVAFTAEFSESVDRLARSVLSAVREIGDGGAKYR
jgi:PPE-repeat protein